MTRNERAQCTQKIIWFSHDKAVFDHEFTEGCVKCGDKNMLIVAERNQSLRCFKCGSSMPDYLCWFCGNGIDPKLLGRGDVPSCLLGKEDGWVKFCEDFVPGSLFGENKKKDIGERRKRAERIFSKIRFEHCCYCEYWNTENVIKTSFSEGKHWVMSNPNAAFCEIGEKKSRTHLHWKEPCEYFKITENPREKADFKRQRSRLYEYLQTLQLEENLKSEEKSPRRGNSGEVDAREEGAVDSGNTDSHEMQGRG